MAGPGGKEVGRVSIRVVPDTEKFRSKLKKSLKQISQDLEVKIPIVLKGLGKARADLARLTEDRTVRIRTEVSGDNVDERQSGTIKLHPDVDFAALRAQLAAFRGRIRVELDVDRSALDRATSSMQSIGKSTEGISSSMGGMSSRMMMIVAAVALLAPLITGLVATLVAALPSLIAMFGGLGGAIALGFDGIKSAFEGFKEDISGLREHVSGFFEQGFTKGFDTISTGLNTLEDKFHTFGKMAEWVGGLFRTFANTMFSGAGLMQLNDILNNTTMFLAQMQPVLAKGTSAFLTLAQAGSESFGRLGNVFDTFVSGFDNWVQKITASGRLDAAFAGLETALTGLSNGFYDLLDVGIDVMAQIGPSVGRFFASFGNFAKGAMPILGTLLNVVLDIASAFMDALAPGLEAMAPAFEQLGQLVGELAGILGTALAPVLEEVGKAIGEGLVAFVEAMTPLMPVLAEQFGLLGQVLADMVKEVGPVLPGLFQGLAEAVLQIVPILPDLVEGFLRFLTEGLIPILPLLPSLLDLFMQLALVALPPIIFGMELFADIMKVSAPYIDLVSAALRLFVGAAQWVIDKITDLVGWVTNIKDRFNDLKTSATNLGNKIREKWDEIYENTKETWQNIVDWIRDKLETAKNWVQEKVDAIKNIFQNVDLFQVGRDIIEGLIKGLLSKVGDLMSTAADIASKVNPIFAGILKINSPSKVMIPIGSSIVEGIEVGMDRREGELLKKPKSLAQRFHAAADKEFKDLPSTIGESWMNSIAGDLGFGTSGAIGSLISELMDPSVQKDDPDVYVVKDVDDAERRSDSKKKKKTLTYRPSNMRRT